MQNNIYILFLTLSSVSRCLAPSSQCSGSVDPHSIEGSGDRPIPSKEEAVAISTEENGPRHDLWPWLSPISR